MHSAYRVRFCTAGQRRDCCCCWHKNVQNINNSIVPL